jgi:hypothetical protein
MLVEILRTLKEIFPEASRIVSGKRQILCWYQRFQLYTVYGRRQFAISYKHQITINPCASNLIDPISTHLLLLSRWLF